MRRPFVRIFTLAACFVFALIAGNARAQVCVVVDDAHDTLSPPERTASVLLLIKQFEAAGERGVEAPCPNQYMVSHIRLGDVIDVTLSGPKGSRNAKAIGLNDLPAVYNQMVWSLITGRPMSLTGVVDRTNVSATQAERLRVDADSIFYARLGYGAIFASPAHGTPSIGIFGYRHELDSFGIDVSFANVQFYSDYALTNTSTTVSSASWVKLEGLYFTRHTAGQTPYFGGGLSLSGTHMQSAGQFSDGSGLQGELTVGYEVARASAIRVFVQADAGLPFYTIASSTYGRTGYVTTGRSYAPSLTISLGLGWQHGTRARRP